MMVRLKHELVPVVCAEAEFQQLVEPFTIVVAVGFELRPFQELHPVGGSFSRTSRNVSRRLLPHHHGLFRASF